MATKKTTTKTATRKTAKKATKKVAKKTARKTVQKKTTAKKPAVKTARKTTKKVVKKAVKKTTAPAPAKKRGRKPAVKASAPAVKPAVEIKEVEPAPKRTATVYKMPSTVRTALEAKLAKKSGVTKAQKEIISNVLKEKLFRFQQCHDVVRQTIRDAIMADIKNVVYPSLTSTAKAYGVSPANVVKWKAEESEGIKRIRPRGRPAMATA